MDYFPPIGPFQTCAEYVESAALQGVDKPAAIKHYRYEKLLDDARNAADFEDVRSVLVRLVELTK